MTIINHTLGFPLALACAAGWKSAKSYWAGNAALLRNYWR